MVLKITVKTLDSRNHQFEIDDSSTVQQFKEQIQQTVNVPSTEQRLIFCGRVLQDDKKLADYDCNEKVIHLVRRPPPSIDNSNNDSSDAPDSNNNNAGGPDAHIEGNVVFNTIPLGPDANVSHILRHIFTLQQALHSITSADDGPIGTALEPMSMTDIERHLHNAVRLLRITVNTINECFERVVALPPSESRPRGLASNRPVISGASSQTDLNRPTDAAQSFSRSSTRGSIGSLRMPAPELSLDDSGVGSTAEASTRSSIPRQSLTTDDLPQSATGPGQRFVTPLRSQNETGRNNILPFSHRGTPELDRYLHIVNFACDLQNQFQGLARRYRQLVSMSCRGGLIVPQASTTSSTPATTTVTDSSSTENQTRRADVPVTSPLMQEARVLGLYIPRIMHHLSHLQHALSDFTVDFSRGRLLLSPPTHGSRVGGQRRHFARRSNIGSNVTSPRQQENQGGTDRTDDHSERSPGSDQDSSSRFQHVGLEEGGNTLTITATTVGLHPFSAPPDFFTTPPNAGPQATVVMSAAPGSTGIRIPTTIPLGAHGTISVDITSSARPNNNNQNQPSATGASQQQPQEQRQQQGTTSNSTQTSSRPIGMISGRILLPFDHYLPCVSPWANYNVASSSSTRTTEAPTARVHIRAPRQQSANQSESSTTTAPSNNQTSNARSAIPNPSNIVVPPIDISLISDVVNTILRPSAQQRTEQNNQNSANSGSGQQHDSFLNILPELALNAASQILGGVLGLTPGDQANTNQTNQSMQQSMQQQQRSQTATSNSGNTPVMMDIDIDDSSSSQSEVRFHDARDSQSPVASASGRPQQIETQPSTSQRYDRRAIQMNLQNHPEWIPVIEADINLMEQQQRTKTD